MPQLQEKHPHLALHETQFLVFTKMHISSKEMAGMMGVMAEDIRDVRFRLQQKLNLEDADELEQESNANDREYGEFEE
jgi:hypothetical protein